MGGGVSSRYLFKVGEFDKCGAGRGNEFSKWGSMKYKAVIFDLGDTLLFSSPSQGQIYADRFRYLGHSIGDENFILVQNAITNAANEQIAKEKRGAPRMPDDEFERMLDCAKEAGLDCVWLSPPEAVLSEDIPYKEDYRIQRLEGLLEWL